MTMRFANTGEKEIWNSKILTNPDRGNIFQGDEFAEQKKLSGWTPRYVIADNVAITVLEKHVFGLGKLWYLPKGPGVRTVVELGDLLPELRDFAHKNGVVAVKIEPELEKTDIAMKALTELGLRPVAPIQPNFSTVLIDLTPDLETVIANMNQKGRHAIRRAERDGVTVKQVETSDKNCRLFYDLLAKTASGSFVIRSYDYYRKFWQRYDKADKGQLFFAYFDGKIVAGAFAMIFGGKSTYKDGASVKERPTYGASHLLQWRVIQWAKENGSLSHDLCGTPPSNQITDASHRQYGLGRFKTSFNKHVTDYVGTLDLIVRPMQYDMYVRFGERIALSYHWRTHHESWY